MRVQIEIFRPMKITKNILPSYQNEKINYSQLQQDKNLRDLLKKLLGFNFFNTIKHLESFKSKNG